MDSVPFSDSVFNWGATSNQPYVLIEPPYKISNEDKPKTQARSANINADEEAKATPRSTNDTKPDSKPEASPNTNTKSGETENTENDTKESKVADPKLSNNATKSKTDAQNTDVRTRSSLEDNILLGVALDGSKRTLPIGEDDISDVEDTKKTAPMRGSNGPRLTDKDKSGNLQDQN